MFSKRVQLFLRQRSQNHNANFLRVIFQGFTTNVDTIPGLRQSYGSLQDDTVRSPQKAAAAWQAADNSHVQDVTQKALIYDLVHQQTKTLEATVPWFLQNMPVSYFDQVPEKFRKDHIKAIAAVKDANLDLYLNLQSTQLDDGRQVLTFIRPGTRPGTLLQMVQELPQTDIPLTRLHVFSAADESMSLNMFIYGHNSSDRTMESISEIGSSILAHAQRVQQGQCDSLEPNPLFESPMLLDHMMKCTNTYLNIGNDDPVRYLRHMLLSHEVAGTEGTAVHVTPHGTNQYWIDVAVSNSLPQSALENLCRLLYVHNFDVTRARLDNLEIKSDSVTLLRALVTPVETESIEKTLQVLTHELKRAKWLDPTTHALVFDRFPSLGVTRAEVITGLMAVAHSVLSKLHPTAYSSTNIYDCVCRYVNVAESIASLFLSRFEPAEPLSEDEFARRRDELSQSIKNDVEDITASTILSKMLETVGYTLKTNVFMPDRYALSFRLDPRCMEAEVGERELPYGVVFVHGRRFNGYHVRFRDIARGGMRLVTPGSAEQHALESSRQYDECYGLAFAQQLKNKDIPEGGSKAVNLIQTHGLNEAEKNFVMRKSVKAMTDAILDLIVDTEYTRPYRVDYWGKKEVLYLGPDEQVTPYDIEWIVERARIRGYGTPAAFMSSKPKAGFNHKEYGVTSEGVNVYLDVALRHVLGIDPTKQSFSVKMTGGPDGDVGGNEIKILIREYGENAKIVGVADHSGCAEDPEGLDHDELLRLVNENLCISNFNESSLHASGSLYKADTEEGVKARNTMHNRLVADAFLPCGGRPNTINETNYNQFLKPDGTPTSRLIVEGANLFVTAGARKALFDSGAVAIVKDSSANKCGVITSSYEISAAMLLTEQEFVNNKKQIVEEVLEKLRDLAKLEATLLFREFDGDYEGTPLPEVSQIISDCINTTTDAITVALDDLSDTDMDGLLPLFRSHLPKTMADIAFDRVRENVPEQYVKNAIASCLASKMVYKEGSKYINSLPPNKMVSTALQYVEKEREVAALMETLRETDMPEEEKQRMLQILDAGGTRTALGML